MLSITTRRVARSVVMLLAVAACGGGSAPTGQGGSVAITGSSTVEPISVRVAEAFMIANPGIAISVGGPGTGDGFKLFCGGEADITGASRPIKDAEQQQCEAAGVEWIELTVAFDGITVITNPRNTFATCLDTADLYALLGDESIGFDKWSDANELAAEVGAPHAPYPDEDLDITGPGEESGTFDSFVQFLILGVAGGEDYSESRGIELVRPDYVAPPNDNVVIEGVAGSDFSLGWIGYAFYAGNRDRVRALEISVGGGPCVAPTPATIADGSYRFSRPLFIYVNASSAESRPEVAAFVDYYLSDEGLAKVEAAGYVRLADYAPTREAWERRTTGSGER